MFKEMEGDSAIIVTNGTYREAPIYTRPNGAVFLKLGSGFVRAYKNKSTSKSTVRIDVLEYEGQLYADGFGRLFTREGSDRKRVSMSS